MQTLIFFSKVVFGIFVLAKNGAPSVVGGSTDPERACCFIIEKKINLKAVVVV